jgi:hypothetical protein
MTTYARTSLYVQEREHIVQSRHNVVGIQTRLRAGQPRNTFSIPWQVQEVCLYSKACRPTLGSTQSTVQWVPRFSSGSRAVGACTGHSPLYCAEIKNTRTYTSTPPYFLVYTHEQVYFTSLAFITSQPVKVAEMLKYVLLLSAYRFCLNSFLLKYVRESRRNTCGSSCNVVVIFVEC